MNSESKSEDALYAAARHLGDPAARAAFLDAACTGDPALRERLEKLLSAGPEADDFFSRNAVDPHRLPPLSTEDATVVTNATVVTTATGRPGEYIGRYKLLQPLGEGGMGDVWMAEQREPMVRRVALKIIKLGMDTQEVVARFEQERQALALMDHPCIAKVLDAGATDNGRPFFVMELVRGVPLTAYCDEQKLGLRKRLALFIQVCQAIQHAHQKGIIHRDLKPSNILVTAGDDSEPLPKVIDFGIAKATGQALTDRTLFTQLTQIIGTPAYMSPEQAGMGPLDIDTRSDIYSLGVLLYELLTGRPPFDPRELISAGLDEMRRVIREKEPPKPSTRISSLSEKELTGLAAHCSAPAPRLVNLVRGDLDWIVMKALDKNRNRRYESATGLAADIQRHMENQPVLARPPGAGYLLSRFVRRHKFGFAAGAAVTITLVGGIAATTWGLVRAEAARKEAKDEATKATTANRENKKNLHRASMADLASALEACKQSFDAEQKGEFPVGFTGMSRWREAVALLTRSLEREPENHSSALWLYETLRHRATLKSDCPLQLLKHEAGVLSASFSPDGTRVVTSSSDGTARVWDAATGQALGAPLRHDGWVLSASFSPDGTRVVTGSWDHTAPAQVWDVATGHTIGVPMRPDGLVKSASFSPDGTRVVTTSDDKTARLWDAATGQALGEPMRHDVRIRSASFSPDGTRVLTADDGNGRVWDAATGHALSMTMRQSIDSAVCSASFSPDGTTFVTASHFRSAQVWDAATGKALGEPMTGHKDMVVSASFSPDGTRVVTASDDKTARLWDAATGQALGEPMHHDDSVKSASFSPDGTRVLTWSVNWSARVWDAATGRALGEPMRHNYNSSVWSARFSPDGTKVVTASGHTAGGDKTARVWDTAPRQALGEPMRHDEEVRNLSFSLDRTRVVTAGMDGTARVWDAATGQALGEPIRHDSVVIHASLSPDGTRVVTVAVGDEKTARVWDAATGGALGEPMRHDGAVLGASFSLDGARVVTASNDEGTLLQVGTLRVWDAATSHALGEPIHTTASWDVASFSPDGTTVVAGRGLAAQVWDAATGKTIGEPMSHDNGLRSASFSLDGTRVVTASQDRTARVWDAATGKALGEAMRHGGTVHGASFSPDGTRVVTACVDHTARVWDAATGKALGDPIRHEGEVQSASFSPDGTRVVTASRDGTTRVWEVTTKEEAQAIAAGVTAEVLAWAKSLNGLRFGEDGGLQVIPEEERIAAIATPTLPPGPWADLAKWINTPAPQRTIDVKSKFSLRQIAERERDFNGDGSVASLKSALQYDPTVPLARLFLAAALERADQAPTSGEHDTGLPHRAAFLRRYDLDALIREEGKMKNEELGTLWERAAKHLLELPAETKIGAGPKPTTAHEEALKAAQKAVALAPDSVGAQAMLKTLQSPQ